MVLVNQQGERWRALPLNKASDIWIRNGIDASYQRTVPFSFTVILEYKIF